MRKYRCNIWLTREVSFYVNASYEKEVKAILERIAAEKKKPDEEITGKYIHEVYNKQERREQEKRPTNIKDTAAYKKGFKDGWNSCISDSADGWTIDYID